MGYKNPKNKTRTAYGGSLRSIAFILLACTTLLLSPGSNSFATTISGYAEVRTDIKRLYELAAKGENHEDPLDGIVRYIERNDISVSNRRYALLHLEKLAVPELKDYLLKLSQQEIVLEQGGQLRAYARRAYWATIFAEAQDEAEEERILLQALAATFETRIDGRDQPYVGRATFVRNWAADKLCLRGKTEHLETIALSLDKYSRNPRAQERIQVCRRQIELINRFGSPLAAIEHIFQEVDPIKERPLIEWALYEGIELQPENFDEILISYLVRIEKHLDIRETVHLFIIPVSFLRSRNWTNKQFIENGFSSIKYFP